MTIYVQFILFFSAINLIESIKFLPTLNIPAPDVIINTDKAFMLKHIGPYSSKLKEEIIHSVVPLNYLCVRSPSAEVCQFISNTANTNDVNIVEIDTILPSRDMLTALPRYNNNQISNLIRNDISRIFQIHRRHPFITKTNPIVHYIDNQFYLTNNIENSPLNSTTTLVDINQSNIPYISLSPSSIILKQIINNKIGFDFLTNTELMSFLSAILSLIDKSYQITDLSESLNLFFQLIAAQSVYILHSCPLRQEHIPTSQPCLIVSTLFLRPAIENSAVLSVYRLIALPAIVNGQQFMYSNMPEAIAFNTNDDQTIMLWNSTPQTNECLFSIYVYCQKKPPLIRLFSSPCLSELFAYNTHVVTSCQITRSPAAQTDIINIDSNVWLFFPTGDQLYCHIHSDVSQFNGIIAINEPSIVRMPCGNTIKCTNAELSSSTCTNRSILIQSTAMGKHEQLSTIPSPIKNMMKQLVSTYNLIIKNAMKDILNDIKDDRSTIDTVIEEFGTIVLLIIFILFLSFIGFFVRWIKHMIQKRVEKLESDYDDLRVHLLV